MGPVEIDCFSYAGEDHNRWLLLYDPVPGGSGFLDQIVRYWREVCARAAQMLERCPNRCETACYVCLLRFHNQHVHAALDRHAAVVELRALAHHVELSHDIPPVTGQSPGADGSQDSDAEADFAVLCSRRGFPVPPSSQYRVDLQDGDSTIADWAYPERRVLIFVDGMSKRVHGNAAQRRLDVLRRAKARRLGFQVVEISAEALGDQASLAVHLDEIALYLEA